MRTSSYHQRCYGISPWCFLATLILLARPVEAQDNPFRISMGYAFATSLEGGGGNAPVGGYLSVAFPGKKAGIEAELAYHRDSEEFFNRTIVLHTVTAAVGPRFESGNTGKARSYFHVLAGLRHDSIEGFTNTAYGGMAGLGADLPISSGVFLRLGADFQIFLDQGQDLKVFRLSTGFGF